jgi:hypothetical protein
VLLDELKEELFRLEVEHKQGDISQQEYDKTKAALDQMLQRALKRASASRLNKPVRPQRTNARYPFQLLVIFATEQRKTIRMANNT